MTKQPFILMSVVGLSGLFSGCTSQSPFSQTLSEISSVGIRSVPSATPTPLPGTSPTPGPTPGVSPTPTPNPPPIGGCSVSPDQMMPQWAIQFSPTKQYYVSPNGNDGNDGLTSSTPLKTATAAFAKLAPGVRLNFAAGTYDCANGLTPNINNLNGGTAAPAEIFSSDGPRQAKFNCQGNQEIWLSMVHGFIFEGVEIYNTSGYGVHIQSQGSGPWDPSTITSDIVIHNSYIHDAAFGSVKASQSKNITIIGSELSNVSSGRQQVQFVAVDNVVLAGNIVHDGTDAFDEIKGGAQGGVIYKNYVYNNTSGIDVGGDNTGSEYLVHTDATYEAENLQVWDNVIVNAPTNAFRFVGCHNCTVTNNSYWTANPKSAIRILPDTFGTSNLPVHNMNLTIVNNIFASGGTWSYMIPGNASETSGLVMTHNVWWWSNGGIIGTDIPFLGEPFSIYTNPELTSPPSNLHPTVGSPVIGKGIPVPFATDNADGVCWGGNPNIGAY